MMVDSGPLSPMNSRSLHRFLSSLPAGPTVLLQDGETEGEPRWLLFREPVAVHAAERLADVAPVLAEVEAQVDAGLWAAGFLSYEAAPAFDPALAAFESRGLPLAWWGIFEAPREVSLAVRGRNRFVPIDWRPAVSRRRYRRTAERIREHIAAGDTYQVNYTFPLEARFDGDPIDLFVGMCTAQRARYCAWVDLGRFAVCCASPELFFARRGERIVSRPMKGTARRGRYPAEDAQSAARLAASEKERAENLMIVDMVRNDLGRIAAPGTVSVDELFTVETYPTVHQLTSTVRARTRASHGEVLRALFPSASITGAPKVATSRIIHRLEAEPRGVYTGSIGYFAPQGRAQLNVAIRTATVDRQVPSIVTYGTGGGIVWDSDPEAEYQECRAKALVLNPPPPDFALLETLLWCPKSGRSSEGEPAGWSPERGPSGWPPEGGPAGYCLLDRHLDRLLASARYFAFPLARSVALEALESRAASFSAIRHRVRLLAYRDGRIEIEAVPCGYAGQDEVVLALDDRPVDDADSLLFHKTTARGLYKAALSRHAQADEVVLWNARGELTEATRANLVLKLDDAWLTPPVTSGLLAGTYRAELLARGRIQERPLPIAALHQADEVFLINSVRGWMLARAPQPMVAGDALRQADIHGMSASSNRIN